MRLHPVEQPANGADTLVSVGAAARRNEHPVNIKCIKFIITSLQDSNHDNYHISEILLWRKVQCLYGYIVLLEALM